MLSHAGRLHRRAILIYLITIVAPVCGLLWLGLQSFDRQRQALATLTEEKIDTELDARTRGAAERALNDRSHPITKYFFTMEGGVVTSPALHSPAPSPAPPEFAEAEQQELALNRPDLALASYRALLSRDRWNSLALSRIARCLSKLGRIDEARAAWRTLAAKHPDERDLSHRPYGIVAALNAGDTAGLYDQIVSGRWELTADQAEFFLNTLDPKRDSPYLGRFRFARELSERLRIPSVLRDGEMYSDTVGAHHVLYRAALNDRIDGLAVNAAWVDATRAQLQREFGAATLAGEGVASYGGTIAVVLLLLTAGIVFLVRDVSREARTNQIRSDFVSSVSHELKTPITLMRLYGETLLRHPEFPEQERRDFYRVITRESSRLGHLVEQILTFSRVERGHERYDMKEGDLAPLITQIVDDYGEWLEHAGFSVARTIPESVPRVRFDEAAVSQAVVNLLDNAAKYSGTARDIALRLQTDNGHVVFEVEDHGVGIPHGEQQKIFERFYRIPNATGKGGYGLGLFMVNHIMQAHGGRVEVDSKPGQGSRFRLLFPAEHEPTVAADSKL